MKYLLKLLSIVLAFFSCEPKKNKVENSGQLKTQNTNKQGLTYDLANPTEKYILPSKLTEISGISYAKNGNLYCVNDEIGKIFVYNIKENDIINTFKFGSDGDYEGIEIVGNIAYVLRSDGKIKAVNLETQEINIIDCSQAEVLEYEGIGYDSESNSLLLAAKEMRGDKKIYEYNLTSELFKVKYSIPESFIDANSDKKEFKPSGIAVHPISKEIYILASAGKKLIVISAENEKVAQYNLDNQLFRQPEGICFSPEGAMFISSEGKGGSGYILRFDATQNL